MIYAPVHDATDLRDYMHRYDFTSMELAAELDIHRVTVAKYRRGELSIPQLLTLALGNRTLIIREAIRLRRRARRQPRA